MPPALRFGNWREAIDAPLSLGAEHPAPVVIDEFPYLARANSALPSVLQNAIAPLRPEREAGRSDAQLPAGSSVLEPHRPDAGHQLHAIVGGTPAYRREFARDDTPADAGDFDDWVQRTVLNPASPLFREARYLLAAEAELHDMGLYHSVLAAIADGNTTRGNIGKYIGRKSGDLAHPLNVLMDCGLVDRRPDAFRENQQPTRSPSRSSPSTTR